MAFSENDPLVPIRDDPNSYNVAGTVDHGVLGGLADDDHPQYARHAGTVSVTGQWTLADPYLKGPVFDSRAYASLQAAIDAAEAAGGGTVLVQEDVALTSALSITGANIALFSGNRSKITTATSLTQLLSIAGATRVRVRGLVFDGDGNVTSRVVVVQTSADDVRIEDCEVSSDTAPAGVWIRSATNVRLVGCDLHDVDACVQISGGVASDVKLIDLDIHDYDARGIYVSGSGTNRVTDLSIIRPRIYSHNPAGTPRHPIQILGDDANPHLRVKITDPIVIGNGNSYNDATTPGTADQISVQQVHGLTISNPTSIDGGDNGIVVAQQCQDVSILGGVCSGNDTNGVTIGSTTSTYARNVTVNGMVLVDNGQNGNSDRADKFRSGLSIKDGADFVVVSGNHFGDRQGTPTQQYGVNVENATDVRLGVNQYDSNALAPIQDEGGNTNLEITALRSAVFGGAANPAAGATNYGSPAVTNNVNAGLPSFPAPFAGVARSLRVAQTVAPGTGETLVATLRIAGSASALTATLSGTATTAANDTNEPTFGKGDLLEFSFAASNNGSYGGGWAKASCELVKLAN